MNRRTSGAELPASLALGAVAVALLAGCSSSAKSGATSSGSAASAGASSTSTSTSATGTAATGTATTGSGPAGTAPNAALHGSLTVLAAASLTGTFTALGADFHTLHPGVTVTFSFGASDVLATQIVNGAPADVFAAASPKTMATVVTAKDAATPVTFASNTLEIATPPKNPRAIATVSDLAKKGVKLAICEPNVPCGATAAKMFAADKLTVHPATQEADVKATLAKVEQGEVDAGVVYVTDVKAAGATVHGVVIPAAQNVSTAYPIVALAHSKNAAAAAAFTAYVTSAHGQTVLRAAGFAKP